MSKIGRKPIDLGNVSVEVKGQEVHFKGPKSSGVHVLPEVLTATTKDNKLYITVKNATGMRKGDINEVWGLHRALLANKIRGAGAEFQKKIEIIGLGFKAALSGKKVTFSLGYSHKIDFDLPDGVALVVDKTGKELTFSSANKELLGQVCSQVRALRLPEPYKGTGIKLSTEEIIRKAGKAKASA